MQFYPYMYIHTYHHLVDGVHNVVHLSPATKTITSAQFLTEPKTAIRFFDPRPQFQNVQKVLENNLNLSKPSDA